MRVGLCTEKARRSKDLAVLVPPASSAPGGAEPARDRLGRPLDEAVREIWQRALGRKRPAEGAGLLDLNIGGRRLMRLVAELEAATGRAVSPIAVLKLGTLDALTAALIHDLWPPPSPLLLLRPGAGAPPVYLVSSGGFILEQVELAREIRHPGPIYGLHLPGVDGAEPVLDRIDAMGRYFVEHVRRFQPEGPYHVVGYSFGGLVAVEMARVLRAERQPLGLVALLDANVIEKFWPAPAWRHFLLRRAALRLGAIGRRPLAETAVELGGLVRRLPARVARRLFRDQAEPPARSAYYIGGLPPNLQRVRDGAIEAAEYYDPAPLDARITLIKSAQGDPHACDPALVWRRLISRLEIATVPGTHTTMLRPPFCRALAEEISVRLARPPA